MKSDELQIQDGGQMASKMLQMAIIHVLFTSEL